MYIFEHPRFMSVAIQSKGLKFSEKESYLRKRYCDCVIMKYDNRTETAYTQFEHGGSQLICLRGKYMRT